MSSMDVAQKFFDACESGKGWAECAQYVADGASFTAQSEPLAEVNTVEAYCDWMAGLIAGPMPGATYEIEVKNATFKTARRHVTVDDEDEFVDLDFMLRKN